MKTFLKVFLAALVAFVIGSILCMFIFFGMLSAILSFSKSNQAPTIKPNTVLRIMLDAPVEERSSNNLSKSNMLSFSMASSVGLNDLVKALNKAGSDPNIKMVYMDLSSLSINVAHLEELRNAVLKFKESGKPVIAYGDNLSTGAYYLATVADRIYLNPFGSLRLQGMGANVMYMKSMFDKLQVDMQVIRHGKYKSAVEPFMLNRMSNENREQTLSFLNSIWYHWLDRIADARSMEVQQLRALIDRGAFTMISGAQDAVKYSMVDGLLYKDELLAELVKLAEEKKERDLKMVDITEYAKTVKSNFKAKDKIAVVFADGEITMGKGNEGITAWVFANELRSLRNDSTVKAVVFRVNSPGGSAQAAEIIARELALLNEVKPVVVSMGNFAASGGYWISMPSRLVIANPTTLTGSIGVFGMLPNVEKGMRNFLGITVETAKTNHSADFPSIFRPLTEQERRIFTAGIEDIYDKFLAIVARGRDMEIKDVDAVAQGRVWTGTQALQMHLVDQLGGLSDAIEAAADLAGLDNYRVREFPAQKDVFAQLMAMFKGGMASTKSSTFLQAYLKLEEQVEQMQQARILARMPFDIEIY